MRFSATSFLVLATAFTASAAPWKREAAPTDADILQFALTLEHLENVFYKQALSSFTQDAFVAANFSAEFYNDLLFVAHDEEGHVLFLEAALTKAGATPVAACTYDFGDISTPELFVKMASVVEGVGVSAYLGAAADIMDKTYLTVAGAILVTEALHQSTQRFNLGEIPMANVFGTPLGLNAVYSIASKFIVSCPDSNVALPVKSYPTLTLDSGEPTSTEGATIDLVPSAIPSAGFYATFVSGLDIIPVSPASVANGMVMVDVPMNVSGQAYVFLTSDDSGNVTDATVLAGPAIIEVTPGSPTFDVSIQ